ncbi:unnamed protein product [Symbiodinium sp. CCMP2456]|nr:unnamed protein product [Symbiodinium sp. CCMP2456]
MASRILAVASAACIGYVHSIRSTSTSAYNLKATAALYIKSMEEISLTKIDKYSEVPGMHSQDITAFLTAFDREVLQPELDYDGYSRRVTATQATVVLGDLHGQLFNLLAFLRDLHTRVNVKYFSLLPESKLFICDPKIQYVFMGDYVDRGERSVEIVMLLFAYKALCPSGIILLQGNHEQQSTNSYYGFSKEVEYKLDRVGRRSRNPRLSQYAGYSQGSQLSMHSRQSQLWIQFNRVFSKLPFVAVSMGSFMATHGGISPSFVRACSNKRGNFHQCLSQGVGAEMVWSDPHEGEGWATSPRGPDFYRFGREIALQFLRSNGLKRLLRGHEQMAKGISTIWLDTRHEYAVQTVFSAADYVGTFCVDKSTNHPLRPPAWDPQMFKAGGQSNLGGMMLIDHSSGFRSDYHEFRLSGKEARKLAKEVTGAHCTRPMERPPMYAASIATTATRPSSPTAARPMQRPPKIAPSIATTTGGHQGFLPDISSSTTRITTTRRTAATATPSTTEAGATNTVETGESAEKTTTTEETEAHPSEGTSTAMERQEDADSEETTLAETVKHADSEETTAMEPEDADSEETTTTMDLWYWPHDDSEDDTDALPPPELGWKDKFKNYFGLALLEERVNDPETEQIELPIHCRERLSQEEAQEHKDYVHSSLLEAEDMEFEARKIIDLQGEATVCEGAEEARSDNCQAMARDVITLKVFMELKGSKRVASRASQEYWPASGGG